MNRRVNVRTLAGWVAFLWFVALIAGYYVIHKPFTPDFVLNFLRLVWQCSVALAILSLAGGMGWRFLHKIPFPPLTATALQAGLGLGMLGLVLLAAGYAGLFKPFYLGLGLLGLGLFFWRATWAWWGHTRSWKTLWKSSDGFGRATGWLCLLLLGFTLLTALAPPLKFDALVYHLTLPRHYLLAGRMMYVPELMYWGMPQTAEMLYTWAMSLGGEPAAVVLGWLAGLVAALGLMGLLVEHLDSGPGWAGLAALMAGFTLASGLAWGYNDWWVMLFALCFLACLTTWITDQQKGLLPLAGVFAGLAIGAKYTAGILLICGGAAILSKWLRIRPKGIRYLIGALGQFWLPALFVVSPWFIKNWLATGNPFYPLLFPAGAMSSLRLAMYQGGVAWGNWLDAVFLPVRATLMGIEGGAGYSASIGPLLVGLGLAAFLGWRSLDERQRVLIRTAAWVAVSGILVWMAAGRFSGLSLQTRLYQSLFPALVALAGAGYAGLARLNLPGVRLSRVVSVMILFVLGLTTIETGLETTRQGALRADLGIITTDQYLADNLGWFGPAMQALNQLPAEARVLMLWETRSLYCLPVCIPDEIIDRWQRERHDGQPSIPATEAEILQSWRTAGYTHLLFHKAGADFVRNEEQGAPGEDWQALQTLLSRLELAQNFGDAYLLYRITP